MKNKTLVAAAVAFTAATIGFTALVEPAAFGATSHVAYRAHFDASTAGPVTKTVTGTLTVSQTASNQTRVEGAVSGLAANSLFVAVPYTDPRCTPLPGVTAFPSGVFFTDAHGHAHVDVTVNPKSINPAGSFTASQSRSVSVRRVVLQSQSQPLVPVPGLPTLPAGATVPSGTPTVPNVVYVEACDRHLDRVE